MEPNDNLINIIPDLRVQKRTEAVPDSTIK